MSNIIPLLITAALILGCGREYPATINDLRPPVVVIAICDEADGPCIILRGQEGRVITYGGNAMGRAAALATIVVLTTDGFMDNVIARGEQLADGLRDLQSRHPGLVHVRALGLMIAAQFDTAARTSAVVAHCRSEGKLLLMTAGSAGTTLRFMPPLTVSAEEIDLALAALDKALVDAT